MSIDPVTWTALVFLAVAVLLAISLLAVKVTPHGRFICAACLDRYDTEPALLTHIERAHGFCTALRGQHTCRLPADGHTTHRCGACGLEWE